MKQKMPLRIAAFVLCLVMALALPLAARRPISRPQIPGSVARGKRRRRSGQHHPRTYTGTGAGRNGELKVEVTFDETSIVEVKIVSIPKPRGSPICPSRGYPRKS